MRGDRDLRLTGWRATLVVTGLLAAIPGASAGLLAAEPGGNVAGDADGLAAANALRLLHEHTLREYGRATPVVDPHILLHEHTLRENRSG